MAFDRPKLSEIVERIKTDIEAGLGLTGASLRRSNIGVLSKAFGASVHLLHGHLDWVSKQIIIDSAESEYLERHAQIWGITRRAADFAQGSVTFTGTDGSVIPIGTTLRRADEVEYTTDAEVTIASGTATADVTAVVPGEAGNSDSGVVLNLLSPISGVNGTATVAIDGITNGLEAETDDSLRVRLLARIQEPNRGGAATDYQQWATEVSGISRAFVFGSYTGPGTVAVFVIQDDPNDPIPNSAKVTEVQEYLDEKRPVTAQVTVFAPIAYTVDFDIQLSPNTSAVRQAVEDELKSLFSREGEVGGTLLRSHINEAISVAAGEVDHILITPSVNVEIPDGNFPIVGTITFGAIP